MKIQENKYFGFELHLIHDFVLPRICSISEERGWCKDREWSPCKFHFWTLNHSVSLMFIILGITKVLNISSREMGIYATPSSSEFGMRYATIMIMGTLSIHGLNVYCMTLIIQNPAKCRLIVLYVIDLYKLVIVDFGRTTIYILNQGPACESFKRHESVIFKYNLNHSISVILLDIW